MEKDSVDSNQKIAIPADLIRTIAIILVVLLHASNETLQTASASATEWWTAVVYKSIALPCVPLFILLSGALLLQPSKLNEPIRVFLKKRLSRIGLAFAFWSGVYIAWSFYTANPPVALTWDNVGQSIIRSLFTGAYYHFWFIYLIIGLYLITPILRVIVASANLRVIRYLILLWFAGVAILPIIELASGQILNSSVFLLGGFIGYFVLGSYLQRIKLKSTILYSLLIVGIAATVFGVWLMTYPLSAMGQGNFFFDYITVNVIVTSVALFLILLKFRPDWPGTNHTTASRLVGAISKNTLPIFLFHVLILESFERGFFGFKLSFTVLNPLVEIPLLAAVTFLVTLGLVLLMRQVPILNKLIG
ncbi:MAG: acyltransferase family protein [Candidatus Bathyarchaeota archaeon]|nr:acyltransferase family protein [Candidatus Bathyarchaeota archaeon]